MGWSERELKKYKLGKQIREVMNSPEYKKAREKDMLQMVLHAMVRFTFLSLGYLESNFRCKRKGLLNFLDYVKVTLNRIDLHDDMEFFDASNKYYKENYDIDVMKELGVAIEWRD